MYGCESWTIKKAERHRIDAFEPWCWRTLESPLDFKEIQPVHPKENQSWIFTGSNDAVAEALILWPADVKNWLIGKDLDSWKGWRQKEKRDGWMELLTQRTWIWATMWRTGGHKVSTWPRDWTTKTAKKKKTQEISNSRNRDTEAENRHVDMGQEGGRMERFGRLGLTYTHSHM